MLFSESVKQLIHALKFLPGIGEKTAQRLTLFLLVREKASNYVYLEKLFLILCEIRIFFDNALRILAKKYLIFFRELLKLLFKCFSV